MEKKLSQTEAPQAREKGVIKLTAVYAGPGKIRDEMNIEDVNPLTVGGNPKGVFSAFYGHENCVFATGLTRLEAERRGWSKFSLTVSVRLSRPLLHGVVSPYNIEKFVKAGAAVAPAGAKEPDFTSFLNVNRIDKEMKQKLYAFYAEKIAKIEKVPVDSLKKKYDFRRPQTFMPKYPLLAKDAIAHFGCELFINPIELDVTDEAGDGTQYNVASMLVNSDIDVSITPDWYFNEPYPKRIIFGDRVFDL